MTSAFELDHLLRRRDPTPQQREEMAYQRDLAVDSLRLAQRLITRYASHSPRRYILCEVTNQLVPGWDINTELTFAQDGKLEILVERNLKQAFVNTEAALDYFVQKNGRSHEASGIYEHVLKRCITLAGDLLTKR